MRRAAARPRRFLRSPRPRGPVICRPFGGSSPKASRSTTAAPRPARRCGRPALPTHSAEARIAIADALLSAGANPRHDSGGETALHAAAGRGPLALVELLIRSGALEWQPDAKGRPPLDAARRGKAADKAAIIELLARPVIRDPSFRAAVTAPARRRRRRRLGAPARR